MREECLAHEVHLTVIRPRALVGPTVAGVEPKSARIARADRQAKSVTTLTLKSITHIIVERARESAPAIRALNSRD